jgi:GNAT superfamily N-acetyltransferase
LEGAVKENLAIAPATEDDVPAIALLRQTADRHLILQFGDASWTTSVTDKSVLRNLKTSRVLVARKSTAIVATARLATKKPWAIDLKYFAPAARALYLHDMAVEPTLQRKGIGRAVVKAAIAVAKAWPADAIRLDAYDGRSGAGPFYAKCGFREVGRVSYRNTPLVYYEMRLT